IQARACGVDQPQRAYLHAATTREPRPAPRPHAASAQRHRTQQRLPALRNGLAHRHLHDTRTSQTPTTTPTTTETHTAATGTRGRHPTVLSRTRPGSDHIVGELWHVCLRSWPSGRVACARVGVSRSHTFQWVEPGRHDRRGPEPSTAATLSRSTPR